MFDPLLRLRHLRCFLETARLGSLSAAADALHVSQPAASKTIRELEDILGVTLFDRSGRRLVLTQAGKVFQQHAGGAMAALRRAQDLARATPRHRPKIAIGALPTASTVLLPRAALAFRAVRPDCLLRVSTGPNWLLLSQLREGALDMVVGRVGPTDAMEGLTFHELYSERVVPVVRPGHPLDRPDWTVAAILDYPLMLPPSGALIAPMVRAFLQRNGIHDPEPAFENVSLAFGRQVVQASDTIWFISQGVVRNELDAGTLRSLRLRDDLPGGPVGVSMRGASEVGPEHAALLDALAHTARDMPQDPL